MKRTEICHSFDVLECSKCINEFTEGTPLTFLFPFLVGTQVLNHTDPNHIHPPLLIHMTYLWYTSFHKPQHPSHLWSIGRHSQQPLLSFEVFMFEVQKAVEVWSLLSIRAQKPHQRACVNTSFIYSQNTYHLHLWSILCTFSIQRTYEKKLYWLLQLGSG